MLYLTHYISHLMRKKRYYIIYEVFCIYTNHTIHDIWYILYRILYLISYVLYIDVLYYLTVEMWMGWMGKVEGWRGVECHRRISQDCIQSPIHSAWNMLGHKSTKSALPQRAYQTFGRSEIIKHFLPLKHTHTMHKLDSTCSLHRLHVWNP